MKSKFFIPFLLSCVCMSSCTVLVDSSTNSNVPGQASYTIELQPTLGLSVGESRPLILDVSGDAPAKLKVTWKNSDSSIISLSQSTSESVTVVGVSSGTATVTALVGSYASASCMVTVKSGGATEVTVTSITLSETEKEFTYDASGVTTFTLEASVITNNGSTVNPAWKSSSTDVATVTGSGKVATVTVHKSGDAIITASAGGLNATCSLHVKDVGEPDTINVEMNKPSASIKVGETVELSAIVSGGVATSTVWQSDSTAVEVSDTGVVTGKSVGSATVSVTVRDAAGNVDTATCFITVKSGEASAYDKEVAKWSKPGHVYFHYLRKNQDYDNWALWIWQSQPKSLEGSLWGANANLAQQVLEGSGVTPQTTGFMTEAECGGTGTAVHKDEHGIIIDVNVADETIKGGKTGYVAPLVTWKTFDKKVQTMGFFIVDQTNMTGETNWKSDGNAEIYIKDVKKNLLPDGKNSFAHIYCIQGQVANYTTTAEDDGPAVINPTIDDKTGKYVSNDDTSLLRKDEYGNGVPTSTSFLEDRPGVGYQIFVPAFADSDGDGMGDLRGIIDKLDYLQNDVGAEVLWLTPIQESNSYHGYDVTDYYKIDPKFGTIEEYQELLFKAHKRGMKVLMDMVINHTSKSNVLFQKSQAAVEEKVNGETVKYRDMYIWKYKGNKVRIWDGQGDNDSAAQHFTTGTLGGTSDIDKKLNDLWYKDGESDYYYFGKFGSGMAELNYNSEYTRRYMTDMCKYWLSFGLDGFRLDATKHIYLLGELSTSLDLPQSEIVYDVGKKHYWNEDRQQYLDMDNDYSYDRTLNVLFWKQFAGNIKSAYPNCFLVGENFDGWDERMGPFYESMDSQFDFQTYFNLNQAYESDIGRRIKNSQEIFSSYRPNGMIDGCFTSNHDIYRLLNHAAEHDADVPRGVNGNNHTEVHGGEQILVFNEGTKEYEWTASKNNKNYAINMAKYYAAVTIFAPGLSWIYYGDELGMSGNLEDKVKDSHDKVYDDHGNNVDRWYRQPMRWGTEKGKNNVVDYTFGGIEIAWDYYNKTLPTASEQKLDSSSMLNYFKAACDIKNSKDYPTYGHIQYWGAMSGAQQGECYFELTDGSRTACVCINNTDNPVSYTKLGWRLLGGFGQGYSATNVPPHGFIVLAK